MMNSTVYVLRRLYYVYSCMCQTFSTYDWRIFPRSSVQIAQLCYRRRYCYLQPQADICSTCIWTIWYQTDVVCSKSSFVKNISKVERLSPSQCRESIMFVLHTKDSTHTTLFTFKPKERRGVRRTSTSPVIRGLRQSLRWKAHRSEWGICSQVCKALCAQEGPPHIQTSSL